MLDTGALRRLFFIALAASLAFRFWFAAALPMTGDEAYFIWWGKIPDWGFYDHPPMVGWWLAALLKVSDAEWWLRLPSVLLPAVLALGTWAALREREDTAWFAAIFVLLAPANVWNVLITTDTPLIYFSFFSALAFLRAVRRDDWRFYLLSGVLLGGAFMSKYFSVLLGFAYACFVFSQPTRARFIGLALVVLGAAWGPVLNVWWNMNHCWANIMFNVYNRHEGNTGLNAKTTPLYLAMMLYILTPFVAWRLVRARVAVTAMWREPADRALLFIAFAPLAVFLALSPVKTIGAHWVLSFVPFVMFVFARALPEVLMRNYLIYGHFFAALHVVAFVAILAVPVESFKDFRPTAKKYDGIVMTANAHELLERLTPYARDYTFATDGYSPSVTLAYNARRYFLVFGEASSHARHDDILTDFTALAGQNILILRKSAPDVAEQYAPYFSEVEVKEINVRGAPFWIVLGRGFNYPVYREAILDKMRRHWYAIPDFLPMDHCYFCERYFPERACRAGAK